MTQATSPISPIVDVKAGYVVRHPNREAQQRAYIIALLVSDVSMLALASAIAYWARFKLGIPLFDLGVQPLASHYFQLACLLVLVWMLLFFVFRVYDWDNLLDGTQEYASIANACTVATVVVIAMGFVGQNLVIARGWLLSAWLLTIVCTVTARFWLRRTVYWLRRYGYFSTPALVIGTNDEAAALAQQLGGWPASGLSILGFVSDSMAPGSRVVNQWHNLGGLTDLPEIIERFQVEEVVVASSAISSAQLLEIFRQYGSHERVNLRLSSGLFDIINTGLSVKSVGYVPLIRINKVRLSELETLMKACVDFAAAAVTLICLAPVMLGIALAIKLDSKGPAVYRRRVLGQGGQPFDAFKFRTMYVNGDDLLTAEQRMELQVNHKLKVDPRITPMGARLRKYSLDELPQLFNVLKGQMSLVGPRMITLPEKNKYGKWDMNLLTVKPGLSGLWQVSGRSDLSYEDRVRLDMQYIRNYSIWLDFQIILRTLVVVLNGKGAY
jgi:exopolysaccharide biosynthesis polyprenyl glycosylphosphotransferase